VRKGRNSDPALSGHSGTYLIEKEKEKEKGKSNTIY